VSWHDFPLSFLTPVKMISQFMQFSYSMTTTTRQTKRNQRTPARTSARSKNTNSDPRPPLYYLDRSNIQGRGMFAGRMIRKGQRIIEYTGERIDDDEADRRYDENRMNRHHTFLFTLDSDLVVDGAIGGNDSIYINHSCEPNCEAVIEDERIFIYALRTIYPGEELLYDYQYEHTSKDDAKFYVCHCGAETCRGTIMKPAPKRRKRAATRARRQA
jgi:uncharacterized protein